MTGSRLSDLAQGFTTQLNSFSPAHIQIHAQSDDLTWIDQSAGRTAPRRLDALHFPAGGRRFRASLEDFLLFLHQERIFTNWKPGWRDAIEESQDRWERIQIKATARRNPQLMAEVLEDLGYSVIAPAGADQ